MDVVKIIEEVSQRVSSQCAFEMLEIFKSSWYSYPRKKYDFESWYPIIYTLTKRISYDEQERKRWKEKYPRLLAAEQVKRSDLRVVNRRRQALDWLRKQLPAYRLVQNSFAQLGYPKLEEICEKENGFVQVRSPNKYEFELITILESLVNYILPKFFGESSLPPCYVIKNDESVWCGMANCIRLSKPLTTPYGLKIFYRLPYVALKQNLLSKAAFQQALSTYLHELAHSFGGDQSASFSKALTEILENTLCHNSKIEQASVEWKKKQFSSPYAYQTSHKAVL